MDLTGHFLKTFPLFWLLYLIPLILLMIVAFFAIRIYGRIYKMAESKPDELMESVVSRAEKCGVNLEAVKAIKDSMLGEKIEDIGVIERRKYRRMIIEHSLHLYKTEQAKQIVLRIKEYIDKPKLTEWLTAVINTYYCPLDDSACKVLCDILGSDEETFLRNVQEYEATLTKKKEEPCGWLKYLFQRLFFAQILKDFGVIEKKTIPVFLKSGDKISWFQEISACIGREKDELLLILKFIQRYRFKPLPFNIPREMKYLLYYPFGVSSRESLRKAFSSTSSGDIIPT